MSIWHQEERDAQKIPRPKRDSGRFRSSGPHLKKGLPEFTIYRFLRALDKEMVNVVWLGATTSIGRPNPFVHVISFTGWDSKNPVDEFQTKRVSSLEISQDQIRAKRLYNQRDQHPCSREWHVKNPLIMEDRRIHHQLPCGIWR